MHAMHIFRCVRSDCQGFTAQDEQQFVDKLNRALKHGHCSSMFNPLKADHEYVMNRHFRGKCGVPVERPVVAVMDGCAYQSLCADLCYEQLSMVGLHSAGDLKHFSALD